MEKDNIFKRIWKILHSMKFGIILLLIIGVLSIAGTLIPQDNMLGYYESTYSPVLFQIIKTFSLHKVYSSWWFMLLIGILSLNLILCSLRRLPGIIKLIQRDRDLEKKLGENKYLFREELKGDLDIPEFFKKNKFKNIEMLENQEGVFYYSQKNRLGYLGSWITNLALLLIILSYVGGKIFGFDVFVHGVPGSIQPIEGTDYWIEIEDFTIDFREDDTVNQYLSKVKVSDMESSYMERGDVRVNHPFRAKKMNIYQNATGWAVDVEAKKDKETISAKTLYQSEIYVEDNQNIALQFVAFYPDYDNTHGPRTLSPHLNNPKLLYSLYYGGFRVDMNVADMGEEIIWEEYSFLIDNPQMFTLLQIGRDPGIKFAALGGIILILGVFLAFYVSPKELMAFRYKDGRTYIWGNSSKNQEMFKNQIILSLNNIKEEEI